MSDFMKTFDNNERHEPNSFRIVGPILILFVTVSIFLGSVFVLVPLFPLLFLNLSLWRRISDVIIGIWESFAVGLMLILCGSKIVVTGDDIDHEENSVILLNHRCRLDWMFLWNLLYPKSLCKLKIILKKELKFIPGAGWAMQVANYIFLERKWNLDKDVLTKALDYIRNDKRSVMLLIFPEGTDYCPKALEKSSSFAKINNLDEYLHCLHPRVTGFTYILDYMREHSMFDSIYDITVAYPRNLVTNELGLFLYGCPKEIHFHVKKYTNEEIPIGIDESAKWLSDVWEKKEALLHRFYTVDKCFENNPRVIEHSYQLFISIFSWFWMTFLWAYMLLYYSYARLFFAAGSILYLGFIRSHGGLEFFEQSMFERKMENIDKNE